MGEIATFTQTDHSLGAKILVLWSRDYPRPVHTLKYTELDLVTQALEPNTAD